MKPAALGKTHDFHLIIYSIRREQFKLNRVFTAALPHEPIDKETTEWGLVESALGACSHTFVKGSEPDLGWVPGSPLLFIGKLGVTKCSLDFDVLAQSKPAVALASLLRVSKKA